MAENMQDKALAAVRHVIGDERKIHQVSAFDDSQGKSVTVRYEGAAETKAAQVEAVHVLMALKQHGFGQYRVALFVTDTDGKNVGSIEVKPPYFGVIAFETVGYKWRGTMPKDFKPPESSSLLIGTETAEVTKDLITRMSGVFRKFYGEKRIDGIALTPLPIEPGTNVECKGDFKDEDAEDAE